MGVGIVLETAYFFLNDEDPTSIEQQYAFDVIWIWIQHALSPTQHKALSTEVSLTSDSVVKSMMDLSLLVKLKDPATNPLAAAICGIVNIAMD